MFIDSSFEDVYEKWLENYVFEYERSPTEDEVYDFYLDWVKDYNAHAAECAAITRWESEQEYYGMGR